MPTRIAINGFGRIGRAVMRSATERDADIQTVGVNDVADAETLAQLLVLDSAAACPCGAIQMEPEEV